jgi:hypothetical protein
MIHLSASVLSVLANLGYRVEEGEGAFYPCYLGSGALPPVAYIRAEGESWQVAVAKRVVPRLAEDSLSQMAVDVQCPDDAAFLVAIVDRDRLYGVFELIASACMHQAPLVPGGERSGETWDPPPLPPFLQAVDRLLDEAQAGQTPPETVIKALREVRIGQDRFRAALLAQWGHACAVTGLGVPRLLRASHCKPWAASSDQERLDPYNGLLLAAHLDAAFDTGYIAFAQDGTLLSSPQLSADNKEALGLRDGMRLRQVQPRQRFYLNWHHTHLFLSGTSR